jgi:hypothetical protein
MKSGHTPAYLSRSAQLVAGLSVTEAPKIRVCK